MTAARYPFDIARPPPAVGDAVLAADPLRHGLGNAATGGIWRVRGAAGSAILEVARLPAEPDPARSFPASDEPGHWNYWRREALAYQTQLAATAYAEAAIAAPEVLDVVTRDDGGRPPTARTAPPPRPAASHRAPAGVTPEADGTHESSPR